MFHPSCNQSQLVYVLRELTLPCPPDYSQNYSGPLLQPPPSLHLLLLFLRALPPVVYPSSLHELAAVKVGLDGGPCRCHVTPWRAC